MKYNKDFYEKVFSSKRMERYFKLHSDENKAFPYMPKNERKRKNISAPLNNIRRFRNRIFHNESICWNIDRVTSIHTSLIVVMGWMNNDLPEWIKSIDRFEVVRKNVLRNLVCEK